MLIRSFIGYIALTNPVTVTVFPRRISAPVTIHFVLDTLNWVPFRFLNSTNGINNRPIAKQCAMTRDKEAKQPISLFSCENGRKRVKIVAIHNNFSINTCQNSETDDSALTKRALARR